MRIPFDIVSMAEAKIFRLGTIDIYTAINKYYMLVEACGWDVVEYEEEMLDKINCEWAMMHRKMLWRSN